MEYTFKKAEFTDIDQIWQLLQGAIARRKADGSNQWQDGYPNPDVIKKDIEQGAGFILTHGAAIIGYCAVLVNDEPAYAKIKGKWLSEGDFVVVHRVAISQNYLGKGLAAKMFSLVEDYARGKHIYSIKADTNFDNMAMMRTFEKLGYAYCGEVFFRDSSRRAYEKVLKQ